MRRVIVFIYYVFIQQFGLHPLSHPMKYLVPTMGHVWFYITNSKMTETVPGFKELIQKQNE